MCRMKAYPYSRALLWWAFSINPRLDELGTTELVTPDPSGSWTQGTASYISQICFKQWVIQTSKARRKCVSIIIVWLNYTLESSNRTLKKEALLLHIIRIPFCAIQTHWHWQPSQETHRVYFLWRWKCAVSLLPSGVAVSYIGLLSTYDVASGTEALNVECDSTWINLWTITRHLELALLPSPSHFDISVPAGDIAIAFLPGQCVGSLFVIRF